MASDRVVVAPEPVRDLGLKLVAASDRLDEILPELQDLVDQVECSGAPTRLARVRELAQGTGNDLLWLADEVVRMDSGCELAIPNGDLRAARLDAQEARSCPDEPPPPRNHVKEFFGGLYDSAYQTADQFNGLTVEAFVDWDGWQSNWSDVTDHALWGITHPHQFIDELVGTETLWENPARWFGEFAPAAVGGALGGSGAATRTTRTLTPTIHIPAHVEDALPPSTGFVVEGAGSGTRSLNLKPGTNPNWGLTEAHLDKHLFGPGPTSLRQIDPAGTAELWRDYIQGLASRPATRTHDSGIQDIIGTFPRADGSGTFQFGIRIAPGADGSWDLVTLLTRQNS